MRNLSVRHLTLFLTMIAVMLLSSNCQDFNNNQPAAETDTAIKLSDYKVKFEQVEGYEQFEMHCITCHSLRYIEMQPDFPEKTWEMIVHKMVKNFGAPIPDTSQQMIVDYLTKVKGIPIDK